MTCLGWMMLLSSKGSWDKDQHENRWALFAVSGCRQKGDSTLKFIVTSLFLFSEKIRPKTLLPHLSLSWLKFWPGFIQGLYTQSYCTVHTWSYVSTFDRLCGIETGGKKGGMLNHMWAKWTSLSAHLLACKNVNHAERGSSPYRRCQTNTNICLD